MFKRSIYLSLIVTVFVCFFSIQRVQAATLPTYTITPGSKTYNGNMMNYSTYNSYTKHYYLLRSYLERLEETGGGTLNLSAGTYVIPNTLYVPSNVTMNLSDGVKIEKGTVTNTADLKVTKTLFQFIRPSYIKNGTTVGGYSGEKNIKIIGTGTVIIDNKNVQDCVAIVAGHNTNVTIQNITFQNMYSGHFIEMDATYTAVINNNKFLNSLESENGNKEAINLDTPDKVTLGWGHPWSKYDKTPDKNITITNNQFYNLDRAIGTHKYSEGKYHENVTIKNNTIEKTRQDAIRVMNWKNAVIENNTIKNVAAKAGTYRAILASGAINPTIQYNKISMSSRGIQFMPWKNNGAGDIYAITYNQLSVDNVNALYRNKVSDLNEYRTRINYEYNVFDENTDYIQMPSARQYNALYDFRKFYIYGSYDAPTIDLNKTSSLIKTSTQADGLLKTTSGTTVYDRQVFLNSWNSLTSIERVHPKMLEIQKNYKNMIAILEAAQADLKFYETVKANIAAIIADKSKAALYNSTTNLNLGYRGRAYKEYKEAAAYGENSGNSPRMAYINEKYNDTVYYLNTMTYLKNNNKAAAKTEAAKIKDSTLKNSAVTEANK